jgi:hypothetical protein
VFRRRGIHIGLVIIDTLMVAAGWSDESHSAEVQSVSKVMRALSDETDSFVLAVDHPGKDVSRGARRSSDKESSSDIVLAVSDRCCLTLTKFTHGPQGVKIPFELVEHDLGVDNDGEKRTECTVKWDGVVLPVERDAESDVLIAKLESPGPSFQSIADKIETSKSKVQRQVDK